MQLPPAVTTHWTSTRGHGGTQRMMLPQRPPTGAWGQRGILRRLALSVPARTSWSGWAAATAAM
eukprot:3486005-Alexandrium_andersonii.AAC.1